MTGFAVEATRIGGLVQRTRAAEIASQAARHFIISDDPGNRTIAFWLRRRDGD